MIIVDGAVRISPGELDDALIEQMSDDYKFDGVEGTFIAWHWDAANNQMVFPREALRYIPPVVSIDDRRVDGRVLERHVSRLTPRSGQAEAIAQALQMLRDLDRGLLIAPCGAGKTVIGTEVALTIGVPTCILVHKNFLAKQWEDALKMLSPKATVGRLKQDQCDTGHTHDIVIASTQSVANSRREYPKEFYESFGLVVADEIHRYAADVWQSAIMKFPARLRLGLTATDYRGDKLWPVILEHFGSRRVKMHTETLVPIIYPVRTTACSLLELDKQPWLDKKQRRAKLLTELAQNEERNLIVGRNLKKAFDSNRKAMVISERRSQLNWLEEWLQDNRITDVGQYVGGKKQAALDKAAKKKIVLATYQQAKEGLDMPDLDVLIMATPQAHIQQTVGRILRLQTGKKRPVVLDFIDDQIGEFEGSWYSRLREYRKLGYEIQGD
jgi:superfamily II DNA or RNA helicase